jgi:hypothetical protein
MIGGAKRASVEELTAPTSDMKRSSFGMAAPRATTMKNEVKVNTNLYNFKLKFSLHVNKTIVNLNAYSTNR